MLRCDSCRSFVPDVGSAWYCIGCGAYVCERCLDRAFGYCASCGRAGRVPRGDGASLAIARRAARRLREVARDASRLAARSGAAPGDLDRVKLLIKHDSAERVGRQALARLSDENVKGRALRTRIGTDASHAMHAMRAVDAADRPATSSGPPPPPPVAIRPRESTSLRLAGLLGLAAVVAVVAFVGDVVGDSRDAPGEAVLSGDSSNGRGAGSPRVTSTGGRADATSSSAPLPETTRTMRFDDVVMGAGLGPGWSVAPGDAEAAAVAPMPNAVDRSAQLVAGGDGRTEACADAPRAGTLAAIALDLRVGARATATLSVGGRGGDELTLSVEPGRATLAVAGGRSVLRDGIAADTWYRVEVVLHGGASWRVHERDGASTTRTPLGGERPSLASGPICLGVSGAPDATVHFDNVIVTQLEGRSP